MNAAHTNRLAKESSPYLLQHQHNPVDWYAWGPEAFEAARAQDKPIFLSVGYSTCYWCHVMERQSFENDAIAAEMNQRFINVKVDREERPDVDQLYMSAVQVLTRQGGWPMSVFLTPDLKPFYGGTYFPPTDMYGRPGFVSVLKGIEVAYRERRGDVDQTSDQLVAILQQLSEPEAPELAVTIDEKLVSSLVDRSTGDYEPQFGGFGMAPKFPRETLLELLLVHQRDTPNAGRMKMIRHALDAMANGGIRDQLGGGFHRYSTDAKWLVPHFEIMLYDNAMLAWCYVEAYRQTEEPRYAHIARGVFDFVLREMTSPDGAFYTAFDAEVDSQEGLNYLWTASEIEPLLGAEDAKLFNHVYGVDRGPNFSDPHHGSTALTAGGGGPPEKSILFLADPAAAEELRDRLESMRQKLKSARDLRKQPLLDTKVLTSWNALMIRALAYGGQVLQDSRYVDAAAKAAAFLLRHHRMPDGGLYRTSRDVDAMPASHDVEEMPASPSAGSKEADASVAPTHKQSHALDRADGIAKVPGFLDDYAYLIQGLIALRDTSGREEWKDHAAALAITMLAKFEDPKRGGFYFTEAGAADLIVRQKTGSDSPLPSGNAVAAMVMLELDQPQAAKRVIEVFAGQFERAAEGMSAMVQAAHLYAKRFGKIEVAAAAEPSTNPAAKLERLASEVVSFQAEWAAPSRLDVKLEVAEGYHINAHQTAAEYVATTLSVVGPGAEQVASIDYPPGDEKQFAFADESMRVYEGSVTLTIRFSASVGDKLTLRLVYQACTDSACLPAIAKQFELVTR
jgi:uncharacterized protein YyaL (SSP411 family)